MHTDLNKVHDHPATLLEAEADRLSSPEVRAGTISNPMEWRVASRMLRAYDVKHNVTFAALDKDALAAVCEAYGRLGLLSKFAPAAALELASAINSLLGMES